MLRQARLFFASILFFFGYSTAPLSAQENILQAEVWTTIGTSNTPDERHENGFVAYNGKLYLLGGRGIKRVQIFDPSTNSWADGAYNPFQMHHFQAVIYDDLIYVIGAYTGACCDAEFGISNVWAYSPGTDQWIEKHEIPSNRRRGSTGAVVYNGKIYIAGGLNGGHGATATSFNWFDEYDPSNGQWKTLPNAPRVRDHFHTVLFNGKLYLTGGRDTGDPSVTQKTIAEIDVYDFNAGSWSTLGAGKNLPTPRGGASSVLYQGEILVIGGETHDQETAHKRTEAFNPITESWRTLSELVVGRHGTQATVLNDAVYIAAGSAQKGGDPELNSIERYKDETVQVVSFTQSLARGWNLAGLPLSPANSNYEAVYDKIDLEAGLQPIIWNGDDAYQSVSNLSAGAAYWLKIEDSAPPSQKETIEGTPINVLQMPLSAGWNMISGPSCDNVVLLGSSTSPAGAIPEGSLYAFDQGYTPAYSGVFQRGRLDQGVGYWVYASNTATLTLTCGGGKTASLYESSTMLQSKEERLGSLSATAPSGATRELFFGDELISDSDADMFNLPPRLWGDFFDVRFINNRRLLEATDGFLKVQADQYPVTLTYKRPPSGQLGSIRFTEMYNDEVLQSHELLAGESIEIYDERTNLIHVEFLEQLDETVPDAFGLRGNYPNPFNPTTRITFDLPGTADLRLEVYDMTGKLMFERSIPAVPAGPYQSLSVDAGSWPAGVYLYSLSASLGAEVLRKTGRMILLK